MKITKETTVGEASVFIKSEHFHSLMEKCEAVPLEKPVINMTVGEFIEATGEDYVNCFFENRDEKLYKAVGRLKQFNKEMESVSRIFKSNEIKPTTEELAAQRGVVFPSFGESMLCDCLEWFHLHSLDDAGNIPLSNYLIVKRKKSAESLYERNLNKIYSEKSSRKK